MINHKSLGFSWLKTRFFFLAAMQRWPEIMIYCHQDRRKHSTTADFLHPTTFQPLSILSLPPPPLLSAPEPATPLFPPVGLKAIVVSASTIVLTWTDTSLPRNQRITDSRIYTIKYTSLYPANTKSKYVNATGEFFRETRRDWSF